MGSGIGPIGQGIEDLVIRIDALNIRTGTGSTLSSLVNDIKLVTSGILISSFSGQNVYSFSGAGFVTSQTNTGVSGTQSRTMSCWVRFGSKANQGILATGANGAGTGMALGTSTTVFLLGYGNAGVATTITYAANTWYHLTYVSEYTNGTSHRVKLYVNGGIAHSAIVSGINLTDSTLRIGMDQSGLGFSGYISRTSFHKKVLSDDEIIKTFWNYKSRFGL